MKSWLYPYVVILALGAGAQGQSSSAVPMTAFALVKAGDKVIAPQAKDRIMEVYSEKSTGGLAPDVWYIDYFDPTAAFKRTEVTFVAGKVTEIKRPKRLFDALTGSKKLDGKKLKIDSDRALAMALKEPMLKKVHLQATQFWLEKTVVGSTWKIRFWAARRGKPDQTVEIGDLYLSSKTGETLKNDLHIEAAD
jgi:hypothetical protein